MSIVVFVVVVNAPWLSSLDTVVIVPHSRRSPSRTLAIGVVLALWVVVTSFIVPVVKGVAYLTMNTKLRRHRVRALSVAGKRE